VKRETATAGNRSAKNIGQGKETGNDGGVNQNMPPSIVASTRKTKKAEIDSARRKKC